MFFGILIAWFFWAEIFLAIHVIFFTIPGAAMTLSGFAHVSFGLTGRPIRFVFEAAGSCRKQNT